MYKFMMMISVLIRQFYLPNPFECFGVWGGFINLIASFFIAPIAYVLVGLFYEKGSFPAWGSFLYLLVYALITGVLWVMGLFAFAWWWVLLVIAATAALFVGMSKLNEWLTDRIYLS